MKTDYIMAAIDIKNKKKLKKEKLSNLSSEKVGFIILGSFISKLTTGLCVMLWCYCWSTVNNANSMKDAKHALEYCIRSDPIYDVTCHPTELSTTACIICTQSQSS